MARFDSADLVDTVQRRGRIPVASGDWGNDNILKAVSDEAEHLFPAIIAARGEFNLLNSTQAVVDGTSKYRVPKRAFDNAVREVWMVDVTTGDRVKVTEVSAEELTDLRASTDDEGTPAHFYFDDGCVVLYPVPDRSNQWNLCIRYHPRPSLLVQAAAYRALSAVNLSTGRLDFAAAPAGWAAAGTKFDLVRGSSPYSILAVDITATVDAGLAFATFTPADLPADLSVGDYLVLSGTTPFLNMPESLHLPAALNAAASIVGPQGDDGLAKKLRDEAMGKVKDALTALAPRTKAPTKKLNNRRWF